MSTFRTVFCLLLFIPGTCNMWEKGKMWLKSKSMLVAVKLSYANIFSQIWLIFVRASSGRDLNNSFFHLSVLQYDFHLVAVHFLFRFNYTGLQIGVGGGERDFREWGGGGSWGRDKDPFFLHIFSCWVQKWRPFLAYTSGLFTNLRKKRFFKKFPFSPKIMNVESISFNWPLFPGYKALIWAVRNGATQGTF